MSLGCGDVIYIMMSQSMSFLLWLYLVPISQIQGETLKGQMSNDPSLHMHPHTHIVCAPPMCALYMHPHTRIARAPPMYTLCVHPPCVHCVCTPHVRIVRAPPMHALHMHP